MEVGLGLGNSDLSGREGRKKIWLNFQQTRAGEGPVFLENGSEGFKDMRKMPDLKLKQKRESVELNLEKKI